MTDHTPVLLVEGLSVRRGERLAEFDGPNVVPYRHHHAGVGGHG
ncbi:MAG: hypothetical protein ACK41W_17920 [Cyanobacteriota bacterium]|jgi:hypothetical protein